LERFLYAASHDLKSPVVTVRTFLGYLEQDLAAADAGRIAKDMNPTSRIRPQCGKSF
jgi:signal transduction histidine kinase